MTNPKDYLKLSPRLRMDLVVCLLLATVTFFTYWQVKNYSFVNYDDDYYITDNLRVQKGISVESLKWSFTTTYYFNWHPLTWISFLIDIQLFGLDPGAFHLTNVFFHIANTLILFLVLRTMTGKIWQSAFVAALFALHPLHVESVAWVSERKDVLSTFFWLLTMLSYAWYIKRPYYQENSGIFRYLLVMVCFLLGLLAKPMLVTLPFVLLLLDYWPLKRLDKTQLSFKKKNQMLSVALPLIWEKVPLFILSAVVIVVTYIAQAQLSWISAINKFPVYVRFSNAIISYVAYLVKMIWPFKLAVIYPHSGKFLGWQSAAAFLILAGITIFAFKTAKHAPFFITGWLWYLGTLVPVIGIVQVGAQALADRYTYIPLIGIFMIFAWGFPAVFSNRHYKKLVISVLAIGLLSFFTTLTWYQVKLWANSFMLFEHAIKINPDNYLAHAYLGFVYEKHGDTKMAIKHYTEALRIKPDYEIFNRNMGRALAAQSQFEEATEFYYRALKIDPGSAFSHNEIGLILGDQGRVFEAIYHYSEAIKTEPLFADAHNNMGLALIKIGEIEKAVYHFREALRINPESSDAIINLRKAERLSDCID